MQPFFRDYIERLNDLYDDFERALDGLPQAALDWVPGPEMNSIAVLIAHTAGSTTYWIGDVVGRGVTQRVRAREFETHDLTSAVLRQQLADAVADAEATVVSLTEQELSQLRTAPGRDEQYTVAWSLLHALEHMATHLGHVQLTRQWWEQQTKP